MKTRLLKFHNWSLVTNSRLVSKYRKELLAETYKHIAEQNEMKGNLKR